MRIKNRRDRCALQVGGEKASRFRACCAILSSAFVLSIVDGWSIATNYFLGCYPHTVLTILTNLPHLGRIFATHFSLTFRSVEF